MNFPKRKALCLKDYDYSQTGGYFITFCTENRAPVLSRITVGKAALRLPQVELTEYGRITEKYIQNISVAYPHISVENYVIMPNHVHLLLLVGDSGQGAARPTVSAVVRSIKALVRKETGKSLFQNSFYDHILCDEQDFLIHWDYIETNPGKWAEDEYHI